jgi:methionine synthase I (cobalamin-dependent)
MTRQGLLDLLKTRVVLLDGGMGTALMKAGLQPGTPGELWNLENPDAVRGVHAAYFEAGSDVAQTNTFGGNPERLKSYGLSDRFEEINAAAVRLAREAAGPDRLVAGNIGPSGKFLPPVGDAVPEALEEGYAAQAEVLARSGADYIAVETMMDLKEALLALLGVRRGAPDRPVSMCMVFEKKKRGFFSPMGDKPGDAARALADEGADLVGANCSMGSAQMREMAASMVLEGGAPAVMKPNAGLPETVGAQTVYRQAPEDFAADVLAMTEAGARVVGGCCGTDERFIAALHRALGRPTS